MIDLKAILGRAATVDWWLEKQARTGARLAMALSESQADVPALCDEVERLREESALLRGTPPDRHMTLEEYTQACQEEGHTLEEVCEWCYNANRSEGYYKGEVERLRLEEEAYAQLQARCYDQGGTGSSVFGEVTLLRDELMESREWSAEASLKMAELQVDNARLRAQLDGVMEAVEAEGRSESDASQDRYDLGAYDTARAILARIKALDAVEVTRPAR